MTSGTDTAHAAPGWFVGPGESDQMAWVAIGLVCLAIYALITLYAAFDRWAERKAHGTPLAKTIPTLLTIALLYEIFPLGHFNILLPICAILIALMADWSRFHLFKAGGAEVLMVEPAPPPAPPEEDREAEAPSKIVVTREEASKDV